MQKCFLESSTVHAPAPAGAQGLTSSFKVKVRCMSLPQMVWEFQGAYCLLDIYSFFCVCDLVTSKKDRSRGGKKT